MLKSLYKKINFSDTGKPSSLSPVASLTQNPNGSKASSITQASTPTIKTSTIDFLGPSINSLVMSPGSVSSTSIPQHTTSTTSPLQSPSALNNSSSSRPVSEHSSSTTDYASSLSAYSTLQLNIKASEAELESNLKHLLEEYESKSKNLPLAYMNDKQDYIYEGFVRHELDRLDMNNQDLHEDFIDHKLNYSDMQGDFIRVDEKLIEETNREHSFYRKNFVNSVRILHKLAFFHY
jgi:hypothetical protein